MEEKGASISPSKRRTRYEALGRRSVIATAVTLALLLLASAVAYAYPNGQTTRDNTITLGPPLDPAKPSFRTLVTAAGDPYVVRQIVPAQSGRQGRRRSLAYFGQLTDFQLADEESPARVEFADKGANSAWRPQEGFHPFTIDSSFRQLKNFTAASPVPQGNGHRAAMNFALLTGDQSDNQQFNETLWVRQLIEGGQALTPNSGIKSDYSECTNPVDRANLQAKDLAGEPNEPIYTGVQDYDDMGFRAADYYDPDDPFGQFQDWPRYPGLMDRAQQSFVPVGLRRGTTPVPTYITNGNHDGLVQGNEAAIAAYEEIATGCFKPFVSTSSPPVSPSGDPAPSQLLGVTQGFSVRPDDPGRRFVDRVELKRIYSSGIQADDHGFAFIDPGQLVASRFAATYYARDLRPGIRFISIDTVSEGGVVQDSSEGNIDDPQWQWLVSELNAARAANKLVVVFGHHPIRSLISNVPDEKIQCTGSYDAGGTYSNPDRHGHDANPGCDLDPRVSGPIHQGETANGVEGLRSLLNRYHNVIAYVSGHTHENDVRPCGSTSGCPAGGNWWEINTSAVADFPQQDRLIEIMDNRDGTLSIFGTLLDFAAPLGIPASGSSASGFSITTLASLGRAFGYNDPQAGMGAAAAARGDPPDRNVELVVDDPRN
jgi:hypothetical protein